MNYLHLTNAELLGSCHWKGSINLLNIVLIGISEELPEHDDKYELHRLLGALLSKELSTDEKLYIIQIFILRKSVVQFSEGFLWSLGLFIDFE